MKEVKQHVDVGNVKKQAMKKYKAHMMYGKSGKGIMAKTYKKHL
mgnify:FL=1